MEPGRARHPDRRPHPCGLPFRLPVGDRHGGPPDRGVPGRRRQGTVDLGHVRPHPRPDRRRLHGRRRLRPLRALGRRRRPDGRPRRERLPLLHLVAARGAHRWGRRRAAGAGLLRTARRRPARQRDRPCGHPLPLGPAPGAGGSGRLDGPRHRTCGSPSSPDTWPGASATGCTRGSPSTSPWSSRRTATRSVPTPRVGRCCSTRSRPPTTSSSRTAWPPRPSARRSPARRWASPTTSPRSWRPPTPRRTPPLPTPSTPSRTAPTWTPACWAATRAPRRCGSPWTAPASGTGTWRSSPSRWTCSA